MNAIQAHHLTRRFGSLTAVDDVSLEVAAGEVVGLIGANGAGKTTLIRMLLGLLPPSAGEVELAGRPPSRETRRRVGYVPQGLGLWSDLTVREHLELVGAAFDTTVRQPQDEAVQRSSNRMVGDLSLGLKRRVAFALALAHHPDVLLLDEPTSGVDPLARSRLWELIGEAARAGAGVLVSTHYLQEAGRCDRIVLLSRGRVAAEGTAGELTRGRMAVRVRTPRWETAWTRLEAARLAVLPAGRTLRVLGVGPEHVGHILGNLQADIEVVPATLEEVFLAETAA